MDNCKEIQNMIDSFEHGNLSLKNEEAFTHHILTVTTAVKRWRYII